MRRMVCSVRQFQSLLQHQRDCFSGFARRPNCLVDYNRLYAYRPTIDVAIDRSSYPSFIISRTLSIDAAQVTTGDVNRGGPLVEYEQRIAAGELVDGDICQERCVVHEISSVTDYRKRTSLEGLTTYNIKIQYALSMISGESVRLYAARSDRVLTLVDKYFEMPRHKAVRALEIYRKAENQAERLSNFFEIYNCNSLERLPCGLNCSTTLENLFLEGLAEIDEGDLPPNLRYLGIINLPKMKALPTGLQGSADSLETLRIYDCSELSTLPSWLQEFTSLRTLEIGRCPQLSALPEGMNHLTELRIGNCPKLTNRCQPETGEDWPKIAHVPKITIDYKIIKSPEN